MCLELNIPLRDAEQYRQPDYTLDIRHLLEDGQQKALEKLAHLRNTMQQMEDALRRMEENQRYLQSPALCGRAIKLSKHAHRVEWSTRCANFSYGKQKTPERLFRGFSWSC